MFQRTRSHDLTAPSRSALDTARAVARPGGRCARPREGQEHSGGLFGHRTEEIVRISGDENFNLVILQHAAADRPLLGSVRRKVSVLASDSALLLK
jgi:hypothetical protein